MSVKLKKRDRAPAARPEEVRGALGKVSQWLNLTQAGLRPDAGLLDVAEGARVVSLVRKASLPADEGAGARGGWDRTVLSADEARELEALVAKASGREGVFDEAREEAEMESKLAALAARARRRPARPRVEEAGAIVLAREWAFDFLRGRGPILYPEHLALFMAIAAQLENGEPLNPSTCRVEVEDGRPVLIVTGAYARPFGISDSIFNWKVLLDHLQTNRFVTVARNGNMTTIGYGSRVTQYLERRAAS
jgi:hypothetical protein